MAGILQRVAPFPEIALTARGRRQLAVTAILVVVLIAAIVLAIVRLMTMIGVDEAPPLDIAVLIVLIWVAVGVGLVVPVALSRLRRVRFRIVLGPAEMRLRDGRTVAWADVARIADDPMSPDRICLWLVERATPAPPSGAPLEQPSPVTVQLRGLDAPEEARATIEKRWREARGIA